jgi:hypothetical protein
MLKTIVAAAIATAAFLFPAAAQDSPPTAADIVTIVYENLTGRDGNCAIFTTEAAVLYYFTPDLLLEYKKISSVDFPVIDGDVFFDTQDALPVNDLAVKPVEEGATTANVEASFKLGNEDRKVAFAMKKMGTRWLIDDISWPWRGDTSTLRSEITAGLADAAANGITP